jgi:flagellin
MLTEMQDLYVDWRRLAAEAEYNDIGVTSSNTTLSFQVSKDGGAADAITVNLSDFNVSSITAFTTVGTTATNGTAVNSTTAAANLRLIDRSIGLLGQMKTKAGSMQNRLENAIGQNNAENNSLLAAQGRITDVNYAAETANMTRLEMQRQVSIASISQAKNIPIGLLVLIE